MFSRNTISKIRQLLNPQQALRSESEDELEEGIEKYHVGGFHHVNIGEI
jgi:hypothetical protein